ncbi:PAAR-like domain-containing protein [Caballeronia ptereochthonis]|uniref:Uncharacterized protein n=1 Tax=Caballeronia ptereochthonis TaxID=1777144 RepID=A0A158A973_9BURK|nr:PAAR-like domain-containing protein [Caballeronia ptereochthonis]SAK54245.1 hypothetical protein AWB83_01507 [Caballeronia ptereochthonis]
MVMVNSSAGGTNYATTVNRTPPAAVPVAYPNNAMRAQAIPNVPHILICGGPIHNQATLIPVTSGDAGGSMGGVSSGTVSSASQNTNGAQTVLVGGSATTRMTDPTIQNSTNAPGTGASPSQTKVFNFAA